MSDRRAVSAGHLAASSVAANEPWRVAVGGNRVQNMTVEQIAHAFAAGQLTLRTPLWPPGTSGWQALGNFEQFQSGAFAQPAAYPPQLSQFEESDDDPTRMWTGSADLSELSGMDQPEMAPLPPIPSSVPIAQRPSARTGPRQVASRPPPRSLPAPAPAARMVSAAPTPAVQRSSSRPRRSSGLWLVAGLVGLVGLGSAVLAARGNWSVAALTTDSTVTAALPAPAPAPAAPSAPAPIAPAEAPAQAEAPAPSAEAQVTPPSSEVNQAQLAKYEETRASAFVAEAQTAAPQKKRAGERKSASASRKTAGASAAGATVEDARKAEAKSEPAAVAPEPKPEGDAEIAVKAASKEAVKEKESAKVSSASVKRATVAAAPAPKTKAQEAKAEPKAAEPAAVSSAVNEAAATALGNAAKLASSCRPPGGPAGAGKARVIYSNDGDVQSVEILTAKFRDTLTGSCVRMVFRRAKIAAFKGEPPTFIKSFTIPEE